MEEELLELHKAFIDAHLRKDADWFVKDFPPDFIAVSRGEVTRPSREEFRAMIGRYLDAVEFTEYRDLVEPTVGFSADASLAWIAMQVRMAGSFAGKPFEDTWAGMMLYARREGRWQRISEVSNFAA